MKKLLIFCLFFCFLGIAVYAQPTKAHDYLNVPGPIDFNKASWHLSWSSHPSANYYKHEYLTAGDNVERFKKMLMLDFLTGQVAVTDLAAAKIAELKKMKETNPIVQYQVFQNNGEVLLDFLLSANSVDGKKVDIIERNIYRYKAVTDKSGQPGVLLFGLSERAYGDDVEKFLTSLKSNIQVLRNAVATFNIPAISISAK